MEGEGLRVWGLEFGHYLCVEEESLMAHGYLSTSLSLYLSHYGVRGHHLCVEEESLMAPVVYDARAVLGVSRELCQQLDACLETSGFALDVRV